MVRRLALVAALAALSACGGAEEAEVGLAVHISGTSALEGVFKYQVRIFGAATPCGGVLGHASEVMGASACAAGEQDSVPLCLVARANIEPDVGIGRIKDIPAGTRTVSVIAVDEAQNPIGEGCAEGVAVTEKEAAQVEIALAPL